MKKKTLEAPQGYEAVEKIFVNCSNCKKFSDGKTMFWRTIKASEIKKLDSTEILCGECVVK
jgi:hypothetical protein